MEVDLIYRPKRVDLDAHIEQVASMHARETPFWIRFQEERGFNLKREIHSLDDLQKLPHFTDEDIRTVSPEDRVPRRFLKRKRELVLSTSSGTTGDPKACYWHEDTISQQIDYASYVLRQQNFPSGENWLCTGTQNEFLKRFLEGLCKKYSGIFEYIQVDGGIVKRALTSPADERERILNTVVERILRSFSGKEIGVYEDISPLMERSGAKLSQKKREQVLGILLGGVATTQESYRKFRKQMYTNAKICGWYGDFMNGMAMMQPDQADNLFYQSFFPHTVFDGRALDDVSQRARYGERCEVVSHVISKELFLPNRRTGDEAAKGYPTPPFRWDSYGNVGRLTRI